MTFVGVRSVRVSLMTFRRVGVSLMTFRHVGFRFVRRYRMIGSSMVHRLVRISFLVHGIHDHRFFCVALFSVRLFRYRCSSLFDVRHCTVVVGMGHGITVTFSRVRRVVRIKADQQENQSHQGQGPGEQLHFGGEYKHVF